MRLIIFSGKGGVGKSTIAANLATISKGELLDADPQATCCYWKDRRDKKNPLVTDVSLGRVSIRMQKLENAVVDLPGAAVPGVQEALSAANFILIPTTYDQASLDAIQPTLELVRTTSRPGCILVNRLHPRTSMEAIISTLAPLDFPICPYPIRERVNHRDLWASGNVAVDHSKSTAAKEIKLAWKWLLKQSHG